MNEILNTVGFFIHNENSDDNDIGSIKLASMKEHRSYAER